MYSNGGSHFRHSEDGLLYEDMLKQRPKNEERLGHGKSWGKSMKNEGQASSGTLE